MNDKTNTADVIEGDFIAMGESEKPAREKETKTKSRAEQIVEEFADQMIEGFDEEIANNEVAQEPLDRKHVKRADFDSIMDNYDQIQAQSNTYSNKIADTINVSDLSEESSALLDETVNSLDKLSSERSVLEKLVGYVPHKGTQRMLGNAINATERQVKRNQSVKEFATSHFEQLSKKQEYVDNNRISVDQIKNKLMESSGILEGMLDETRGALEYMNESGDGSKAEEIKGKKLVSRISKQIVNQRELIEHTLIYEGLASVVSENIESALPEIKSQFIDQVSITSSLKTLKSLQDNVTKINEITLELKGEGIREMDNILEVYKKEGITESQKAKDLRAKHRKATEDLRRKADDINENISRELDKEIENNLAQMERTAHVGKNV